MSQPAQKKPDGYAPIVDTREQLPLDIPGAVRQKLDTGDYSCCREHASTVTVERKSAPDLLACIGRERERFTRELERMRSYRFRAIVIECDLRPLLAGKLVQQSLIHPSSVLGSLAAWSWRYGCPTWFASDPTTAARLVERLLMKAHVELKTPEVPAPSIAVDIYRCPPLSTLETQEDCLTAVSFAAERMAGLPDLVPLEDFNAYLTAVHLRWSSLVPAGGAES